MGLGNFRLYLEQTLNRRCEENPQYSLRAFARNLDLEPSVLSKVLRGKRQITQSLFQKLGRHLELSPQELIQYRPKVSILQDRVEISDCQELEMDSFKVISDWYHYAILELISVRGFKGNTQWISQQLGISETEVDLAVESLQKHGHLKITEEGEWIDQAGAISIGTKGGTNQGVTNHASTRLQRQYLLKSIKALDEVSVTKREHTSIAMAVNKYSCRVKLWLFFCRD